MAQNGHGDTDSIPAKKARELVTAFKNAGKNKQRISDAIGGEIRTASSKYGISRKILTLVAKLDDLEAEQLADWRDEFDHWWEVLGLQKRADSAPRFEALSHQGEEQPSAQ